MTIQLFSEAKQEVKIKGFLCEDLKKQLISPKPRQMSLCPVPKPSFYGEVTTTTQFIHQIKNENAWGSQLN